jgi:hydroxymethylglutaryl-CoA reductase (NADPH)
MKVPSLLLRQLYTFGSLENTTSGVCFSIKNRLADGILTAVRAVHLEDTEIPLADVSVGFDSNDPVPIQQLTAKGELDFPLKTVMTLHVEGRSLTAGRHKLRLDFEMKKLGSLSIRVKDTIRAEHRNTRSVIPLDKESNFSEEIILQRQQYVQETTGVDCKHIGHFSLDPKKLEGNIENFTGVAQIPLGFAGPLLVNGEKAQGEFMIPLATTEGTLVASYNRGMKVLNHSGGVKCTVSRDHMQRAPVFIFPSAREARDFCTWVDDHMDQIRLAAEATSSVAKLNSIDKYLTNKFAYMRFNYSTGDAAGQNMVGRATFAACSWILEQPWPKENLSRFYLESNLATDKKASQVNIMQTRGKRVTAECTIQRDVLLEIMRVEPESLHYHSGVATIGAFLSGANNNGAHSPNAITAMFIATGQDVANVSESSAGIFYSELLSNRDLYISITLPSLIVATYGGGTGLPTQRESLEIMGCYGRDKAVKFAEIVAGVVLAGEISLGAAISSLDWVSSHEKYGRNR